MHGMKLQNQIRKLAIAGLILISPLLAIASNEAPQTFTIDGQLYQAGTNAPLLDSAAKLTVQVINPNGTCLLYEEQQTVNTSNTEGHFTVHVGSLPGSGKRTVNDPGRTMGQILQNLAVISANNVPGQTCASGAYNPSAGAVRYLRLIVTPSSSNIADTLTPDLVIDSVPTAVVAQSLQGLERSSVLQVNNSGSTVLTQANLEALFTTPAYTNLQSILAGNFMKTDSSGASLPSFASDPAGTANGDIWFDSTTGQIKYQTSGGVQTVGAGGAGSISSLTVGSSMSLNGSLAGTISSGSGTIDLTNTGVSSGTYSKVTVDTKGRVTAGTISLVEADIPNLTTPGKVSGNTITSGTISGSAAINTSGNLITTGTVSGLNVQATNLRVYNGSNYIQIAAPALGGNVNLTLPTTDGNPNEFLKTDGSGVLSWASATITSSDVTGALGYTPLNAAAAFSGDVSGVYTNVSLDKLKGKSVTAGSVSGQMMIYDGSQWGNNVMSGDATLSSAGVLTLNKVPVSKGGTNATTFGNNRIIASNGTGTALVDFTCSLNQVISFDVSGNATCAAISSLGGFIVNGGNTTGADISLGTNDNKALKFKVSNSVAMTISQSGNVGIGTTFPSSALDVSGAFNQVGIAAPAVSPANEGRIYFDASASKFKVSQNGAAYVDLVSSGGITSLSGQSGATQTLAISVDNSVATPTITSATNAHTWKIPMASNTGTTAGLLNKTDYDSFVTKLGSATSFAGDVSGVYNAMSVQKLQGKSITAGSVSGQMMIYDGTAWNNAVMSGDATMSYTGMVTLNKVPVSKGGTNATSFGNNRIIASNSSGTTLQDFTCSMNQVISFNASGDGTCATVASLFPTGITNGGNSTGAAISIGTNDNFALNFKANNSIAMTILPSGNVGIANTNPSTALDVSGAINQVGIAAPSVSSSNQGRIYYDVSTNKFRVSQNGAAYVDMIGGGSITSLGGQTGGTQTLAISVDNSVAAPTISSATNAHTWKIPMASNTGTTAGLLSKTEYDAFNTKLSTTTSFAGDVSGAYNATSVDKIKGKAVTAGSVSGQMMIYDGTAWNNAMMSGDATLSYAGILTLNKVPVSKGGTNATSFGNNRIIASNGTGTTLQDFTCSLNQVISFDASGNATCAAISSLGGFIVNGGNATSADISIGTNDNKALAFKVNNSIAMTISQNGAIGIGTALPSSALDISGAINQAGIAAPAASPANQGRIYYDLSANKFKVSQNGAAYVDLVSSGGITSFGGQTGATQTISISVDNSVATPTISSATNAHTWKIPMASNTGTIAGLLSKTDYDVFNTKLGTSTSFAGDVSGVYNSTSVDKIKGKSVTAATVSGQIMIYDGTAWVNNIVSGDATLAYTGILTLNKVPVSKGGTNANSFGNNRIIASNGTGTTLQDFTCSLNQVITFDASGNSACAYVSSLVTGILNGGNSTGADISVGTNDNKAFSFKTNNTIAMTISQGGAIGIGTSMPNSGSKLSISGDGNALFMAPATNTNGVATYMLNSGNGSLFGIESAGGGSLILGSSPYASVFGTQSTRSFQIGTNNAIRMTIDSAGLVGIGISNPTGIIDVQGGTAAAGSGKSINLVAQSGLASGNTNGGNINLTAGTANGTGTPGSVVVNQNGIKFNTGSGTIPTGFTGFYSSGTDRLDFATAGSMRFSVLADGTVVMGNTGTRIVGNDFADYVSQTNGFAMDASGTYLKSNSTRQVTLTTSGNLGIGSGLTPTTKLQVAGTIAPSADNTYPLGGSALRFTAVYAANGTIQTSDQRLKKNIQDSDLGLAFIRRLRPVSYQWTSGADRGRYYGLLAQETESTLRDVQKLEKNEKVPIVDHDLETDRYGLRYTELIAPLIKAVQELYHQIDGTEKSQALQREEMTSLQKKMEMIQKENAELKARLDRLERLANSK